MNKKVFFPLLLFFMVPLVCFSQDPVFTTMKTELDRNFSILKEQPTPAYYIFLRLDEIQTIGCSGRLGRLQSPAKADAPTHILSSSMRVGNRELDNSHEIRESGYGSYRDMRVEAQYVPVDNNPKTLKTGIWLQLDELYKQNTQIYEQIKANMAVKVEQEDKSPDFSAEEVKNYYEKPIRWEDLKIDTKVWEQKVKKYSAIFDKNPDILDGMAYLYASLSRKTVIDTEGRESAQNAITFQLILTAEVLADDGMYLPLNKTWMGFSQDELPSDETVMQAAQEMSDMLSALKKAPVVESFTGPAILSPEAAGVFFHEIFGHRVEGSRLKQETDAQTFKKKINEQVLPKHLSVTFDPTMQYYDKTSLSGYYKFDDEGIPAQRVEIVKNGILKNFLMGRTPIEGFSKSNGHGRAQVGASPISRQSNMLVESTQKLSKDELVKRLRKEAKAQGKEYAYYFKEVSGGFTNTSRYSPNSFNVNPLIVYRIYTDGRPDELVRGVDMVGTPLAMFSQIEACGNEYRIFNGTCGAESGSVPVSCIAPALLVKHIETQKRAKSQTQPPLLPKPEVIAGSDAKLTKEELIAKSIREEVERSLSQLKIEGLQRPFFIAYTMGDVNQIQISATNGSLLTSDSFPFRGSGARLLIGDYQCTDENFQGMTGGASGFDGTPSMENDEAGIRYTIWRDLDAIYKNAAETYEQKISAIKQLNIPAKELELPDWDKTPTIKMNDIPMPEVDFNKAKYEEYAKAASAVFNDYKEIVQSNVTLQVYAANIYFYNTEKTEFRLPLVFASLEAVASSKTEEGEDLSSSIDFTYGNASEFPPIEEFKKKCAQLAERLIEEVKAPKIKEAYAGPVLFEDLAVVRTFYSNFFYGDMSLIAQRKPLTPTGFSYGGNSLEEMMDKRITAREITIEDWTGTKEYKGTKLLGYFPIDGQGVVPPEKLTLVENGILKTLLSDRIPTPKVPHSNGHSLFTSGFGSGTNTGVVRMTDTRTKSRKELREELFKRAKEEGYEYAYIVRDAMNGGGLPTQLYQVNIADGTEKRIRSASINNVDAQVFKKIVAVSDQEMIYNGSAGNLISVIVPDAILFEEMQIQSDRIDNFQRPPLVSKKH